MELEEAKLQVTDLEAKIKDSMDANTKSMVELQSLEDRSKIERLERENLELTRLLEAREEDKRDSEDEKDVPGSSKDALPGAEAGTKRTKL